LTVGLAAAAFLLWLLTIGAYAWATWKPSAEALTKFVVETAAVYVAFYVAWHTKATSKLERDLAHIRHAEMLQMRETHHLEILLADRRRMSFAILRSLDEQDRVDLRIDIRKEFEAIHDDGPAMKAKLDADKQLEKKVAKVLGSFEDMAIAIRAEQADEPVLFYSMSGIVVRFYEMLRLHIEQRRSVATHILPPAYCELEHLAKAWKENRSAVYDGVVFDLVRRPWA